MVSGRRFEDVHMEGLNGLDTPKQYGYGLISNDLICFLWCNVSFWKCPGPKFQVLRTSSTLQAAAFSVFTAAARVFELQKGSYVDCSLTKGFSDMSIGATCLN